LFKLRRVDEVLNEIVPRIRWRPRSVEVPLTEALNLIPAKSYESSTKFPTYPKATVDGYAVRSVDVAMASPDNPVALRMVGEVREPLKPVDGGISRNECMYVETGCFLPRNADAVVMVEDCEVSQNLVLVRRSVSRYENVSMPGEELDVGDPLAVYGRRLKPWNLAALSMVGIDVVEVLDLRAKIVATGREFVEGWARPFTLHLVSSWLKEFGFRYVSTEIVGDEVDAIASSIAKGVEEFDTVILLGGTSMGRDDWSVRAIEKLNPSYLVHGIAIQPGKTTALSVVGEKLVVAMSGLPVAAFTVLELVLNPLLSRWLGVEPLKRCVAKLVARARIPSKLGLRTLARVRIVDGGIVPLGIGGSGAIRSLLLADGYVVVPEDLEGIEVGEEVDVYLLH